MTLNNKVSAALPLSLTALALAACASGPAENRYVVQCQSELDVPGEYWYSTNTEVPNVVPQQGATREGAEAINACIRQKAAADGVIGIEAPTANAPGVAPPKKPQPTTPVAFGNGLPLPTQYPLQPGDAELWPTLTVAQQQRAILFLRDGGTIRSSLSGD